MHSVALWQEYLRYSSVQISLPDPLAESPKQLWHGPALEPCQTEECSPDLQIQLQVVKTNLDITENKSNPSVEGWRVMDILTGMEGWGIEELGGKEKGKERGGGGWIQKQTNKRSHKKRTKKSKRSTLGLLTLKTELRWPMKSTNYSDKYQKLNGRRGFFL